MKSAVLLMDTTALAGNAGGIARDIWRYKGGDAIVVGIWEGIYIAIACPMHIFCGPNRSSSSKFTSTCTTISLRW